MLKYRVYDIEPVPKPRQTRSVRYKRRRCDDRYWAYVQKVQLSRISIPNEGYHIIFVLKMPQRWSKKQKAETAFTPCQKTPDKDNLEKGLLDAIFTQDKNIWDGRVSKVWGYHDKIIVLTGIETDWIKDFLTDILIKGQKP